MFLRSWHSLENAIEEDLPHLQCLFFAAHAPTPIYDLIETCIGVAVTEGQISDGDYTRLTEWLAVERCWSTRRDS